VEKQPAAPEITRDYFEATFADLRAQPSHLQIAEAADFDSPQGIANLYHQAVENIRDTIYNDLGLDSSAAEMIDGSLLCNIFGRSSDASETRMVLFGFKPAAFVSNSVRLKDVQKHLFNLPTKLHAQDRIIHEGHMGQNYGYTHGNLTDQQTLESHTGFVYNVEAVEQVAKNNAQLFKALGYDTSLSGADFAESVLSSPNLLAQSVLLGYTPLTSIFFYLACPDDLDIDSDPANTQPHLQAEVFQQSLQALLTPQQLAITNALMGNENKINELGIFDDVTMNEDYIYPTARNERAQKLLAESGMTKYVRDMQEKLYSPSDPHSKMF